MPTTISIEAAGPELRELLEHLPNGETVDIVGTDGSRVATLVSARAVADKALTREEWLAEWDALSQRITKAWKSEKNAIQIISEMRPVNCTLDANVLVAASQIGELHHAPSLSLLGQALADGITFFCPVLILPECSGAVARVTGKPAEAASMTAEIERLPNMRLAILDEPLAARAAEIAGKHRLRGADSVYVAVAEHFKTTLLTWDSEVLTRVPSVVRTMTPTDWLAQHPATP